MGRPLGKHGKDFEAKRSALLAKLGEYLVAELPHQPSLRQLASAAGVSVPTLRHYFGTREDVIAAYLTQFGDAGAPYLAIARTYTEPFHASIPGLVDFILEGLVRARVIDGHAVAFTEALAAPMLGPIYLRHVLEPTLQAVEARLADHQARGEMRKVDPRTAALALVAPLLLAALHQCALGGEQIRPLDLASFGQDIAAAFLRSYQPDDVATTPLE